MAPSMKGTPLKILASPTKTPPKSPAPGLRTPHHLDDPQRDEVRVPEFKELQIYELTEAKKQAQSDAERRKEQEAAFQAQQAERLAAEAADLKRAKMLREKALKEARYEGKPGLWEMTEPGYGPLRWLWPVAHKHPRQWAGQSLGAHDVPVPHQPLSHSETGEGDVITTYAATIEAHEADMSLRRVETRLADDDVIRSVEERKKQEREDAAMAMREQETAMLAARAKAERDRIKRIKKEMAEETRKQKALQEKKAAERAANAQAQRKINEEYAKAHGHWDWSIKRQPVFSPEKIAEVQASMGKD